MNRGWKRLAALLLIPLMVVGMCPISASAATEGFETNNCLIFATEPGETSPYVSFYKDGYTQSTDAMTWVDEGVHGKALSLDGLSEYMQVGFYQLRMSKMTFSTWINFRGSVDPANPAGAYWQRLFTIHTNDNQVFYTVSPHAVEPTYTNAEGQLDGVFMEYYRGYTADEGEESSMWSFTGARPGQSHFGLPQNEWHHMAVVIDEMSAKLYVDGNLVLEEIFLVPVVQMYANYMKVGHGVWNDPTLNALVDDMMMFDLALNQEQIAAVMQTGSPLAVQNSASVTTVSEVYMPTTETEVTVSPNPTDVPEDKPFAPFGLPVWGFGVVMALLAVIVILTVLVNMYEANWRKTHGPEDAQGEAPPKEPEEEDTQAPAMSIKEAALKKRQEELDRFLEEEKAEEEHRTKGGDNR